jgi:hypothetical protein
MPDSRDCSPRIGAGPVTTATATSRIAGNPATANETHWRFDLRKHIAVFPEKGHRRFAVDAVKISCTPAAGSYRLPLQLRRGMLTYLQGRGFLKYVNDGLVTIDWRGFKAGLSIGRDSWMRCSFRVNIMRRLRERLRTEGLYPMHYRVSGANGDNFIDPSALGAGVDLHARAMQELHLALVEVRERYRSLIEPLFSGVRLDPDQVHVAISRIELTWDVPCKMARAMPILWQRAWCLGFPQASINFGLFSAGDEVRLQDANEGRDHFLRAETAKGDGCKMYTKHDNLIRFEEQLDNRRAGRMLGGRPIRLDTVENLAEDLEALAAPAYDALLAAQESLQSNRVFDWIELFRGFHRAGKKADDILDAFLAGKHFHHVGETHCRELARLKRMGWARHVGRGLWAPGPMLHRSLKLLQCLRSCGEGPT